MMVKNEYNILNYGNDDDAYNELNCYKFLFACFLFLFLYLVTLVEGSYLFYLGFQRLSELTTRNRWVMEVHQTKTPHFTNGKNHL